MSVKVNLLPGEIAKSERTAQRRNVALLGAAVVVAGLAGITFLQMNAVGDAEDRLAAAEAANQLLQARLGELAPFADLELRQSDAVAVVTTAMAREASLAGVLQDLAAVLPPTTEVQALGITISQESAVPQPGGGRLVEGTISVQGQVLIGISPGVERLLTDVERAAVFDNVFVTTTAVDEFDVSVFSLDAELGPEVLTRRYVTGGAVAQ